MCDNDCCKTTKPCAWAGFAIALLLGIILTIVSVPQAPERTFDKMAALTEMCIPSDYGKFCETPGGNAQGRGTDANNNTVYEFKTTFEFRSALRSNGMWAASTADYPVQSEYLGISVVPGGSALLADVKPPDVDKLTEPEHFFQIFDYAKKTSPAVFGAIDRKMFAGMIPDLMRMKKEMKLKDIEQLDPATGKKLLAVDPILFCPVAALTRELPNEYKGPRKGIIISKGSTVKEPDPVTEDTKFDNSKEGTEFKVTYPEVSGDLGGFILGSTYLCYFAGQLKYPADKYDYGWQWGTNSVDEQYILKEGTFPATYGWGFSTGNMQIFTGPDQGTHINEKEDSDGKKDRTWVAEQGGWVLIVILLQIPWIVTSILICCGKCKRQIDGAVPQGNAANGVL